MTSDRWLGLICCLLALILILVWIPLDVETGYLEKVRRSVVLGDSLAPTIAGAVILLGGLILAVRPNPSSTGLNRDNLIWIGWLISYLAVGLLIMRFAGPLVTSLFAEQDYRSLRGTVPWKYIGYLLGGTCLVFGLISLVEGQFRLGRFLIAVIATLIIALLYDLPFEDILLPPNGDV